MHDVFSDPYRRAVLYYLQEWENPADVCELGEWVIRRCQEAERDDADRASRDRTAEWVLHRHVLSMDEFGLVEYDPEVDTVLLPDDVCVTVTPPWDEQ